MKIYFVRHGKTQWNLESRYQGSGGDSPLLPQSYTDMKRAGTYLKQFKFEHVFASPIKRARITAERIASEFDRPVPLSLWSRLAEFGLGKWEGQKFDDVKANFPVEFDAFRNHPEKYQAEVVGGESFEDVIQRMTPAIQLIAQRYPSPTQNVLVVSHGAALNTEINALLGTPIAHLRDRGGLANTSTTVLETQDGGQHFTLSDWNNTEYLGSELDETSTI
ncbi:phosphoglycerate mutase [Secundilactobacillus oryzae JCM 18671]|uniref:Phosphoglycerate mutase n=1 Tax=Secundilactobacillus oryzae JCM 18671 TaxID=1291743 RepID=A0A081BGN3_9LACO|nr:histidine phosphatase family protein [Secundilactobacillus oryzae]GAK47201.1 phosphoglycerate mutase [Secundilactobacillus oryzae JCM 18671]